MCPVLKVQVKELVSHQSLCPLVLQLFSGSISSISSISPYHCPVFVLWKSVYSFKGKWYINIFINLSVTLVKLIAALVTMQWVVLLLSEHFVWFCNQILFFTKSDSIATLIHLYCMPLLVIPSNPISLLEKWHVCVHEYRGTDLISASGIVRVKICLGFRPHSIWNICNCITV